MSRRTRIVGPLPLTLEKPGQGEAHIAAGGEAGPAGDGKPTCSRHGAMSRVTPPPKDWWRCLECNIGVEVEEDRSGPTFFARWRNGIGEWRGPRYRGSWPRGAEKWRSTDG